MLWDGACRSLLVVSTRFVVWRNRKDYVDICVCVHGHAPLLNPPSSRRVPRCIPTSRNSSGCYCMSIHALGHKKYYQFGATILTQ